jgi:ABC-type molybdate transport system permease subunit
VVPAVRAELAAGPAGAGAGAIVWLLSLPLRLIGITVGAVFGLLRALLTLPARLLGGRG